jgi:hypothetical protein
MKRRASSSLFSAARRRGSLPAPAGASATAKRRRTRFWIGEDPCAGPEVQAPRRRDLGGQRLGPVGENLYFLTSVDEVELALSPRVVLSRSAYGVTVQIAGRLTHRRHARHVAGDATLDHSQGLATER